MRALAGLVLSWLVAGAIAARGATAQAQRAIERLRRLDPALAEMLKRDTSLQPE